jgi:hypothetical protein
MPYSLQLPDKGLEDEGLPPFETAPRSRRAAMRCLQRCTRAGGNIAIVVGTSAGLMVAALVLLADPSASQRAALTMKDDPGLRGSLAAASGHATPPR